MSTRFAHDFLPGALMLQAGRVRDYRTLERFHYVQGRPATWAAVCVVRYIPNDAPRATSGRIVGVGVLSYPSALLRARHRTFGLKPMRFGERLRWANANLRTISRVIVHPQFRSIGLSTSIIDWLCNECSTSYIEASARMGQAHPLFERAGFTRVEPVDADEPLYFWRDLTSAPSPGTAGRGLG